jgi:hypothetical protein
MPGKQFLHLFATIIALTGCPTPADLYMRVISSNSGAPIPMCKVCVTRADTCTYTDSAGSAVVPATDSAGCTVSLKSADFRDTLLTVPYFPAVGSIPRSEGERQMNPLADTLVVALGNKGKFEILPVMVINASAAHYDRGVRSLGSAVFSAEEIQRAAGTVNDISRYLSSVPSVVSSLGEKFDNTLYVRGGRPNEIAFMVDGIEFENINHFSRADGCGGPIGFLNSDFIRSVEFFSGNTPVSFPGRLSSVVNIEMKGGTSSGLKRDLGLKLTGGMFSLQGPAILPHCAFVVSGRYVDFSALKRFVGDAGIPRLGDLYAKINFMGNRNLDLSATGIFSHNRYQYSYPVREYGNDSLSFANSLSEKQKILQGGAGVSLRYRGTRATHQVHAGFSGRNGTSYDSLESFADSFFTARYARNPLRSDRDGRVHIAMHSNSSIQLADNQTLSVGARLNDNRYDFQATNQLQHKGTCITCDKDNQPVEVPWTHVPSDKRMQLEGAEVGIFGEYTLSKGRFQGAAGIRADYYRLLTHTVFSPRLSSLFTLGRMGAIMAGAGLYHQFPTDLPIILFNYLSAAQDVSPDVILQREYDLLHGAEPLRCWQGSLGYEVSLWNQVRTKVEVYGKWYDREYPFFAPGMQEVIALSSDGKASLVPQNGNRKAYGLELSMSGIQRSWYFYSLGASLFDVKNRFDDSQWYNDWTNVGFTISVSGGITIGRGHSISLSAQGAGGRPFCEQLVLTDCVGRKFAIFDQSRQYFAERLNRLLTTNLRYGYTRRVFSLELESFVEIINLLNYKPVLEYKFNGSGFQEVRPFGITPIVGLSVRF